MVVHQDEGRRRQLQRAFDDLARIDRGVIHRAFGLNLIGNQHVLAVQEQHLEFLASAQRAIAAVQ